MAVEKDSTSIDGNNPITKVFTSTSTLCEKVLRTLLFKFRKNIWEPVKLFLSTEMLTQCGRPVWAHRTDQGQNPRKFIFDYADMDEIGVVSHV